MKIKYDTTDMQRHLSISKIFGMVEPHTNVLDVGCSTGFLGAQLRKNKSCKVTGMDSDKEAIKIARKRLDKTFFMDIEKEKINVKGKFDYIIFADVLEHTRNPETIISKFKKFLKPGGFILVSLPNVAHPLVRMRLLLGKWNYSDTGILDKTHLRFFTQKTARRMLEGAGLKIIEEKTAGKFVMKKTFAAQFVFRCRPK
jgi:2-polyprenyl-3-methyl-5-hydroxy-6-metoxy-1,4-benzoquinol methylase